MTSLAGRTLPHGPKTNARRGRSVATVTRQRLGRRIAQLSDDRMQQVCSALRFALGCDE